MRLVVPRAETVIGSVVIRRPVQDVYRFYRDFANLPRFIGDVVAVEQVGDTSYRWVVAGPFGLRMRLAVTVTERRANRLIRFQTRGPAPLRARWQLEFAAGNDARSTRVREQLTTPLGVIGRASLALIGKFPDQEVQANLSRLKQVLESGPDDDTPAAAQPASSDRHATPNAGERETR